MRIIGGKFKGKSLIFIKSKITRPLKDSVKENIFNIISHSNLLKVNLNDSNILDLFSGVGSFGLECISRGSKKVTFIEKDKTASEVLKKNISNLAVKQSTNLINYDIFKFFKKDIREKFEIIFLDPPFSDISFHEILRSIYNKKVYPKNHIIIIHREDKKEIEFKNYFKTLLTKKYGRSKIIFGKFLF